MSRIQLKKNTRDVRRKEAKKSLKTRKRKDNINRPKDDPYKAVNTNFRITMINVFEIIGKKW